jgi:peroxiredoxin
VTENPSPNRTRLRVWAERLFIAGALVFILYRLGPQIGALVGLGSGGEEAPAFRFTALDGRQIDSDELRGKVVVLNFWATWCGPCRLEMPSLQSIHEDRAEDGVVVLGLSTDGSNTAAVQDFLSERFISYPVGMATPSHQRSFGGISMIPTTFIIDKEGVIRHTITGYAAPPVLRVAINRLLDELPAERDAAQLISRPNSSRRAAVKTPQTEGRRVRAHVPSGPWASACRSPRRS